MKAYTIVNVNIRTGRGGIKEIDEVVCLGNRCGDLF
jgi:hypothetical protein